jgi:hypothetical protein
VRLMDTVAFQDREKGGLRVIITKLLPQWPNPRAS